MVKQIFLCKGSNMFEQAFQLNLFCCRKLERHVLKCLCLCSSTTFLGFLFLVQFLCRIQQLRVILKTAYSFCTMLIPTESICICILNEERFHKGGKKGRKQIDSKSSSKADFVDSLLFPMWIFLDAVKEGAANRLTPTVCLCLPVSLGFLFLSKYC